MLLLVNHIHSFLLLLKMENIFLIYIFSGREIPSFHFTVEQFIKVLTECYVRKMGTLFLCLHTKFQERETFVF